MKATKVILIWSLVIVALCQGFGQFTKFDPSNTITIYNNSDVDTIIQGVFRAGGYESQDAKIIDFKIENGIFEIEIDFTEFDGYMCLVLHCDYDHKKHNRVKYYFNAHDFSFIKKEIGQLEEVLTKKWIYKQ